MEMIFLSVLPMRNERWFGTNAELKYGLHDCARLAFSLSSIDQMQHASMISPYVLDYHYIKMKNDGKRRNVSSFCAILHSHAF